MTIFYFNSGTSKFFETENLVEWCAPTPQRPMYKTQIVSLTQIAPYAMSERFEWCQKHIKQFSCWSEGFYDPYGKITVISFWIFIVPDPEEAIMFKLRWNE